MITWPKRLCNCPSFPQWGH